MAVSSAPYPYPRVLTCAQVAELLGVSKARVYRMAREGDLPAVRYGRSVRFLEAHILIWLLTGGSVQRGDTR